MIRSQVSKFVRKVVGKFNFEFQKIKVARRGKNKIFIIGQNKTGTTSIKNTFEDMGYLVGNQRHAELMYNDYFKKDFKPLLKYCRSAEVFQDFPFSYPETYKHVDNFFPKSKFILTVRDSSEQWYNSITKFHARRFGNGSIPSMEDLQRATYVEKGWVWKIFSYLYPPKGKDIYNKGQLMQTYIDYNKEIIDYFKERPKDLLVLNLSEENAFQKFINFLDIKTSLTNFPWENKTSEIETK